MYFLNIEVNIPKKISKKCYNFKKVRKLLIFLELWHIPYVFIITNKWKKLLLQ